MAAFLSEKGLAPDEAMAASELREAQHAAAAAVLRRAAADAPSLLRTLADEAERLQKNNAEAISDMISKAEAAVDKDAKDKAKALLEVWKGQYTAKAGSEPDAAQIAELRSLQRPCRPGSSGGDRDREGPGSGRGNRRRPDAARGEECHRCHVGRGGEGRRHRCAG